MARNRHNDFHPTLKHNRFARGKDGVITRTVTGRIDFWNRTAEKLYGWRKEEAVGKVSHELLQTQFPRPLDEIEAELAAKGRWEGKLVHETRDGRRVEVESRWVLDRTGEPGAVIEMNTPFNGGGAGASSRGQRHGSSNGANGHASSARKGVRTGERPAKSANLVRTSFLCLLVGLASVWLVYLLAGHRIIEWLARTESPALLQQWLNATLAGRRFTPLAVYYREADAFLVYSTLRVVAVYALLVLLIRAPAGALLLGFSSLVTSLALFAFFEAAPSLIRPLRMDLISPYHAYKASYVYDEQLAYRERPFNRMRFDDFRGSHYSPIYRVDIPPRVIDWQMDEHGFRNSRTANSSEVIVLGDSFLEFGDNAADTFVARLESHLDGARVTNLSKSGYGPPQYLEVLKRYGLQYQPKYALFGFYEGNDMVNIRNFLVWQSGVREKRYVFLRYAQTSFLRRYWAALDTGAISIWRLVRLPIDMTLDKVARQGGYGSDIHQSLALLQLADGDHEPMLVIDRLDASSSEDMLKKEEWRELEKILREFKRVSADHGIVPIIVYIPSAAHVYAQFSTDASGYGWLRVRDRQIAAQKNTVEAFKRLAQTLDIEVIDVSARMEAAARDKLLYHRLDSHWTADGRELAAKFVAEELRARGLSLSSQRNTAN